MLSQPTSDPLLGVSRKTILPGVPGPSQSAESNLDPLVLSISCKRKILCKWLPLDPRVTMRKINFCDKTEWNFIFQHVGEHCQSALIPAPVCHQSLLECWISVKNTKPGQTWARHAHIFMCQVLLRWRSNVVSDAAGMFETAVRAEGITTPSASACNATPAPQACLEKHRTCFVVLISLCLIINTFIM